MKERTKNGRKQLLENTGSWDLKQETIVLGRELGLECEANECSHSTLSCY
jgi:hypothetical protein